LVILVSLELGTSFVQTFEQFVVVRALFGIAMGGMYGNVSAIGLEDAPVSARGILSGLLQEGFALGYMIAAVAKLFITTTPAGWRAMFWVSAGPPALLTIWRIYLPETNAFKELKRLRQVASDEATEAGLPKPKRHAMKEYLLRLIYLTLLMGGFNFMSHGSQDLYPAFLQRQLGFSDSKTTVTIVVMNIGAIIGGALIGHMSTFVGRRLSIIIASVLGAAVIPAWTLLRTDAIMAGAFFEQFFVQGAWGYTHCQMTLTPSLEWYQYTFWNFHQTTPGRS
jgi:SHS family lactate transporter-like MFS transporter